MKFKTYQIAALILASLSVSGCASVFEGTSQQILVSTSPSGASCVFERQGFPIASVPVTPGSAFIKKDKYDIVIKCNKPGYEEAVFLNHSGVAGATVANVIGGVFTGGIAWAVDSASGADNKYDSPVNISLAPMSNQPSTRVAPSTKAAPNKSNSAPNKADTLSPPTNEPMKPVP